MSSSTTYETFTASSDATVQLGHRLASLLGGGEVIVLQSDLGGGKTTLVRGIAAGMGSSDSVQSPTFTISRLYRVRDGLEIHHFDFYRLDDPGIIRETLREALDDPQIITIIEWPGVIDDVLPLDQLQIMIDSDPVDENARRFTFVAEGKKHAKLVVGLQEEES